MKHSQRHHSHSHWDPHFSLIGAEADKHRNEGPESIGFKAFNLLRMARIGLPVPPALVIGTYYTHKPESCLDPLFGSGLPALERITDMKLGDSKRPLIVSVRSGAPVSMPGMMETILNIGLCDATVSGLLRQTGNPRLVWDSYRRLIATYGTVVAGLPAQLFEQETERLTRGKDERRLDFSALRDLTHAFLELYRLSLGQAFPQNPEEQLVAAILAVFASWHAAKACKYREINRIDGAIGTAVTIQQMVFGNAGSHAGAGVGFTRDPITGEKKLWVDFLVNAQGEDVVSGQRNAHGHESLAASAPAAWQALQLAATEIEREFADMQDFEFTVQDGSLFLLQSRNGKRTPLAAARIALDLFEEGILDRQLARQRTAHLTLDDLATIQITVDSEKSVEDQTERPAEPLATAISACNGVATGEIALDIEVAQQKAAANRAVILVRNEAQTSDIEALDLATGLLTRRGARTSHAAVVARQLGKVCLVGCDHLRIDLQRQSVFFGNTELPEGSVITLDGNSGLIYAGEMRKVRIPDPKLGSRLTRLRNQSD